MKPDNLSEIVKAESAKRSSKEILQSPVTQLLGVSVEIAESLKLIGIKNVFDLATSRVFNAAREIAMSSSDPDTLFARIGLIPSDIVNKEAEGKSASELADEGIGLLEGIGKASREKLVEALHLQTIRDFSLWAPFRAAREILNDAYGIEKNGASDYDPDSPAELLPVAGKHATETLSYDKIFINRIDEELEENVEELTELTGDDRQIDILAPTSETSGFSRPATGAVLTFTQTWTPQALSLGQLLHSIGLAPGESTKVAVIEWSRQETGSLQEDVSQAESLTAATEQSRAIAEIQNAVASEVQRGESSSSTHAKTSTSGGSAGIILGPIGFGGSHGSSSTRGSSRTVSSSSGRRNISAEMTQNITSSTKQSSTSVRNKRASVVREVKQEEKEEIRTRVITNYNHSHALSVHYYEVVQIYKTAVQLSKYERCIFIPMKPLDFKDVRLIDRYRTVLYNGALTSFTRDLIEKASGDVQAKPKFDIRYGSRLLKFPPDSRLRILKNMGSMRERTTGMRVYLKNEQAPLTVSQDDFGRMWLDTPVEVGRITKIELDVVDAESENPYRNRGDFLVNAQLGDRMINQRIACEFPEDEGSKLFLEFKQPTLDNQLSELLNEEQMYYSQLVWQSLTADEVAMQLSNYTYHGRRLIEQIDAVPLTTYGNYIVFRWYPEEVNTDAVANDEVITEDRFRVMRERIEFNTEDIDVSDRRILERDWEWEQWKKKHIDLSKVEEAFIPLSTDGVFAEAVLGRYNASEKLDITRFWDWQESPIPHQAPDIAPIQSGSRAADDGLSSPHLESPVVNIQNPQPLPDPAGLGAVLNAVTTSNLFRDMSGMQQTAALLQQGMDTTGQAAVAGASLAAQNMKTMADLEAEKVGAVRDVLLAYMGAKPQGSSGSNSRVGAMINEGKKMDQQKRNSAGESQRVGAGTSGASSGSGVSGSSNSSNGSSNSAGTSHQEEAFNAAVNPVRSAINAANDKASREAPTNTGDSSRTGKVDEDAPFVDENLNYVEKGVELSLLLSNFPVGSWELQPAHKGALDNFIANFNQEGRILLIEGRASRTGGEAENQERSEFRAEEVQRYLVNRGIDPSSILEVRGVGEAAPLDLDGPLEDPGERSVLIKYNAMIGAPIPPQKTDTPKLTSEPEDLSFSKKWSVRIKLSEKGKNLKFKLPVGSVDIEIKKRKRNAEDVDVVRAFRATGFGLKFGVFFVSRSRQWTDWLDFETNGYMKIEGFRATQIRITSADAAVLSTGLIQVNIDFPEMNITPRPIESEFVVTDDQDGSLGLEMSGAWNGWLYQQE